VLLKTGGMINLTARKRSARNENSIIGSAQLSEWYSEKVTQFTESVSISLAQHYIAAEKVAASGQTDAPKATRPFSLSWQQGGRVDAPCNC
jgi:hypothetical protein